MSVKNDYIEFCKRNEVSLFFQPSWWNMVNEKWDIIQATYKDTILFFPFYRERKLRIHFIRNPFLTPYSGFIFNKPKNEISKEVKQKLIDEILLQLPSFSIFNIDLDYHFNGDYNFDSFNVTSKITNILSLNTEEIIYKNFKSSLQRQIKKGQKNLSIVEKDDIKQLYDLHCKTFEKQNEKVNTPFTFLEKVWQYCKTNNSGKLLFAVDPDGNFHAGMLLTYDTNTSYYLVGGTDSAFYGSGAMSFLMWNAIKISISLNKKIFDFEGSMKPSINKFFKNFNPQEISYINIQRTNSLLFKIMNKK